MKIIVFLILGSSFLFANQLTVKDGDATLLINGQEFIIPKDHNLTVKSGTMICFVKGLGTVIINDKIKLNSKNPECYQIPLDSDADISTLFSSIGDEAVISKEKKKAPSSSRGIETDKVSKGIISLPPSKKEVVIYGESYGPLPVTLSIKKTDGTIVKQIVNEEATKTLFRIPTSYLENDSKIEVTNAFGDKLVDKKVSSILYYEMKPHSQIYYEKDKHTIVDILFGTDRKKNPNKSDWENYYTGERGKLVYGVAEVSIPKTHQLGAMERPGWGRKETIGKHVVITKLEKVNEKKFLTLLKSKLSHVQEKDILIIIHGFNVSFSEAIRRTAQISYDLSFRGVPMTYSWPSRGEVNEYMRDESSIQYTVPHLVTFFKKVIEEKGDANIHVIGHSMGTRALTNALKELSYIYPNKLVFKNIILAAPDIDKDVFMVSLLPYITKTTEQITLYASSDDSALKLSNTLHGEERIGQAGDNILVLKSLDTIDATGIDTSLLGHSYFAEKEVLVNDLKDVIDKSLPPTKRKSLIEQIKANIAYWKFKFETQ